MGVPGFFAWLVKKYPTDILQETLDSCDGLYLDWNGGIHPVCRSILAKYRGMHTNQEIVEKEMIQETLAYLQHVVQYHTPKKTLFIAIDGVAPRAKMNQQRSRRFKSAKDKEIINDIRKKYKEPLDYAWDTNCITPGTAFMEKLCNALHEEVDKNPLYAQFETILSDATEAMEGEHKIISHIRKQQSSYTSVIYGLDADLIFLSLLCTTPIFLMRERDQFGDVRGHKPFWFMDIQELKTRLAHEIQRDVQVSFDSTDLICDFVVYCFLLGNDFIPKAPCLFIHEQGINTLMNVHKQILNSEQKTLTHKGKINMHIFSQILNVLSEEEGLRLQLFHKKNRVAFQATPGASAMDIELAQYDQLWPPEPDAVMLGKKGWKDRYYTTFFGIERHAEKHRVKQIGENYIQAIQWTLSYYTDGIPSWDWYYGFHHAPVLSDMAHYCRVNSCACSFFLGSPVSSEIQLLSVLPPQSFHLLPSSVQHIPNKIQEYYPTRFTEDCTHKKKRWQTIPNIPFISLQKLQSMI